jgi:alkylation response protein AidB-like acyl-CoA dehydrogenase
MPVGVSADHDALRESARDLLTKHCPPAVPRATLDAPVEELPALWSAVAEVGWFGLAVPTELGGSGFGLGEVVVVLEELGRALAPGPFTATMLAAAMLASTTDGVGKELLPDVVAGRTAAVALGAPALAVDATGVRLSGRLRPVVGGGLADLFLIPVAPERWCVIDAREVTVAPLPGLDPTRRPVEVVFDSVHVPAERCFFLNDDLPLDLAAVLHGAEACGVAGWCLDTAVAYAKTRTQFGRPIGQFQAVKHKCADGLVAVEQAFALVWDAARADLHDESGQLAVSAAATIAFPAAVRLAKDCIQVLGGIGFTWEHDAHMYLRRALSLRQLLSPIGRWRRRSAELAMAGARRQLDVDLPVEADGVRAEVREFLAGIRELDPQAKRRAIVAGGYVEPSWPRPWGRAAGPAEQLVIEAEFHQAKVRRPHLAVAAWVVPTLIEHGTDEQQQRWLTPTLTGELTWCQLFSEPGAGSDLAGLSTRAERTDAGWFVTGQKVWTTMATIATHAILLARTAPATPQDRQAGITYFVLDMTTPGIDIRPLRELTGEAMFNEVFLDNVFVPDDHVIGAVGDGWRVARSTLANERVSMGTGSAFGASVENLLPVAAERAKSDPATMERLGELLAEAQSLSLLGLRATLRALGGQDPGPESSIRKLLGGEHEQRLQELGLELLGPDGLISDGAGATWGYGFLVTRCLTIAGGTSEVQRNVIAERLLGLPRDV